ncbi:hypothetical protein [Bradyrhizobium sp.]|uniref:hypothetical protein n=1 Tax=Bradyrhizobium sp. TaxID=376 RepID=UPI00345CEE27
MNSWNNPRARESTGLHLALVTFALQLGTFELQANDFMRSIGHSRDRRFRGDVQHRKFAEGGKIVRQ